MIFADSSNILFRSVFAVSNTFEQPFEGVTFIYEGRECTLASNPNDDEIEISKAGQSVFVTKDEFNKIWARHNIGLIITSFLLSIFKLKKDFSASYNNLMVLAVDGNNSWRKKFYEENKDKMLVKTQDETYKGNRKREENNVIDWTLLYEMYDEVLETMKNYSDFVIVKVDGAEADDVIACLTKYVTSQNEDEYVYIISTDEDFAQLTSKRVHLWSPHKKAFNTYENPKRFLLTHILTGDKADNIPAIEPRMGDATAIKRIDLGLENYLATDALIRERFEINKTLIDFSRIPKEIYTKVVDEFGSQYCDQFDQFEIAKFCWKYGLRKIVENMRNFKLLKNCSDSDIIATVKGKQDIKKIMDTALFDFLNS